MLVEEDPDSVRLLWEHLTDWEPGSQVDAAVMVSVHVTLAFLHGRAPVAAVGLKSVTAISESWVNWNRQLRTAAVYEWLREHGIDLAQF